MPLRERILWLHEGLKDAQFDKIRAKVTANLNCQQVLLMFGIGVLATSSGSQNDQAKQLAGLTRLLTKGQQQFDLSYEECMEIVEEVRDDWTTEENVMASFTAILPEEENFIDLLSFDQTTGETVVNPDLGAQWREAFGSDSDSTEGSSMLGADDNDARTCQRAEDLASHITAATSRRSG